MKFRIPAMIAAVAGIAAASSCGDPTAIKAQFENVADTLEVFALNGTPVSLPSAIRVRSRKSEFVVRVGSDFNFDIAWDINEAGEAVAHTVRAVATELVPVRRVGLRLVDGPFEAIHESPTGGFTYDSSTVVPLNKVLLVDSFNPACSQFSILGVNVRAKIQLDSVVPARRMLYMRIFVNPNCGFKDFTPGIPKE